ncbi:hypothetical protein L249_7194 [Ophiocordyceps polyrhachis-furcata BCC 54312]|uniref:Ribosomal protein L19 n=1 Tax=Ophiocordyceps polyrhachis-furcata BCC 54312 TaxID=1330021 RepID=A0A367LAK9_9HYPO|nr:hypothetical protein L249_7194 [Ophiocordyceps polyrhachis-furcata BCC 54312]
MNAIAVAVARRPTSCLKEAVWLTRRTYATTTALAPPRDQGSYTLRQRNWKAKLADFQVWPQMPTMKSTPPDPMPAVKQKFIDKMDMSGARTQIFSKERRDCARVGDVLMVTTDGLEPFAGVFIQIHRSGPDTSILLRGNLMNTGVERWFKIYSPSVTAINIISRRRRRSRRARLTYMRHPKHDMGNVDELVLEWKKERQALSTKATQKVDEFKRKK